jgi:hypothetical protein
MSAPSALAPVGRAPRLALGAALGNRRFRALMLWLAGVPIVIEYLWRIVVSPFFRPLEPTDFSQEYLVGARMLAAGQDPYYTCSGCVVMNNDTFPLTVFPYPPFLLWLMQPLARLDLHMADLIAVFACQAFLAVFLVACIRALGIRDRQLMALTVLATISWWPVINLDLERNAQLLLLAVSGIWFLGWMRGDRWWGGLAIGFGIAVKLVQLPSLALLGWGRRWLSLLAGVVSLAALWLVASPNYLVEYLVQVLPRVNSGTGFARNVAPMGALVRLFGPEPDSFFGAGPGASPPVRALAAGVALIVIAITVVVLRRPRGDSDGRALEAAAVVAATPLVSTLVWPGHLVLLLIPMLVLTVIGLRQHDLRLLAVVAAAWVLIGPVQVLLLNIVHWGVPFWMYRALPEGALLGVLAIWVACLLTVRTHDRLQTA